MKPRTIKVVLYLVLLVASLVIVIVILNQQMVARDREIYLATSSTTTAPITSQEYLNLTQPTRELPESIRNHAKLQGRYGYTSYGDDYGNLYVQVFHSREPIWNCDLYFIKGDDVIPLHRARPKFLNCFDIYTDGLGTWYAVDPGYVAITGETRVYRLKQDEVIKIYGLEELRGLDLYFSTKEAQWYGKWALAGATKDDVSTQVWHTINFPMLDGDPVYTPVKEEEITNINVPTAPTTPSPNNSTPTPPVGNSTTSVTIETDETETPPPAPFPARFISSVVWPPVVATTKINPTQPLSCTDSNSTKQRIQGREYCITVTTEGAAGSVYKNFTYVTQTESLQTTATFVLRFPNCQNYDSPDSETCTSEQTNTDIDSFVDNLIK